MHMQQIVILQVEYMKLKMMFIMKQKLEWQCQERYFYHTMSVEVTKDAYNLYYWFFRK